VLGDLDGVRVDDDETSSDDSCDEDVAVAALSDIESSLHSSAQLLSEPSSKLLLLSKSSNNANSKLLKPRADSESKSAEGEKTVSSIGRIDFCDYLVLIGQSYAALAQREEIMPRFF
jgi:hypothetical protein